LALLPLFFGDFSMSKVETANVAAKMLKLLEGVPVQDRHAVLQFVNSMGYTEPFAGRPTVDEADHGDQQP
jgi:hypothetical protein